MKNYPTNHNKCNNLNKINKFSNSKILIINNLRINKILIKINSNIVHNNLFNSNNQFNNLYSHKIITVQYLAKLFKNQF